MAQKLYEESYIQAIGDALRNKLGHKITNTEQIRRKVLSANAAGHNAIQQTWTNAIDYGVLQVPNAVKFVIYATSSGNSYLDVVGRYLDNPSNVASEPDDVYISHCTKEMFDVDSPNGYLSYKIYAYRAQNDNTSEKTCGTYAEIVALDANGDVVYGSTWGYGTVPFDANYKFYTKDMASAINRIGTDTTETVLIEKDITENGIYYAATDEATGFSSVTVDVQPTRVDKKVTENGVFYASNDDAYGYRSVEVDVQYVPQMQSKELYFNESGHTVVTADEGFDGLNSVDITVNVAQSADALGFNMDVSKMAAVKNYYWYTFWDSEDGSSSEGWDISTKEVKPSSTGRYAWYAA